MNDQITEKYLVDLNFKESELIFSISEQQNVNNFLSIDYFGRSDKYDVSVESQNFNFYFLEYFKKFDYFKIQKLLLSGSSKLSLNKNFSFNELFLILNLMERSAILLLKAIKPFLFPIHKSLVRKMKII